ncbi:tyrosine-type recombinase/integrase, partial [Fulvivirga imtechensis]|uniref:tyrosine-type recombinase/integrase n=1 Tax=Fulvivirga imtechensis TaxID=881893 RepID=UPI00058D2C53
GYSPSIVHDLPYYLQEFLHHLEQKRFTGPWPAAPVSDYLEHLKKRKKVRQQGLLSNHSINNHLYMLKKFSEYLFKVHRQILLVTASPLEVPGQPGYVLSKADIEALYEATEESPLGSRDRAMLSIYYGCGLRRSEGVRLNVDEIHRETLWVRESKNGKGRVVPLSHGVQQHLSEYLCWGRPMLREDHREKAFFLNRHGVRIQGGNLCVRLKKLLTTSGLI